MLLIMDSYGLMEPVVERSEEWLVNTEQGVQDCQATFDANMTTAIEC